MVQIWYCPSDKPFVPYAGKFVLNKTQNSQKMFYPFIYQEKYMHIFNTVNNDPTAWF